MVRNSDARIHWKTTLQIQSSNTKTATTCTVSMRAQDIWKIGARPNCNQQFTTRRKRRNHPHPKSSRSIFYYARSVDSTPLIALNNLASKQAHTTEKTIKNTNHMLDYLATNTNAKLRFYPSNMILNVHSDASYLSTKNAKSRAAGHFFLGCQPHDKQPIRLSRPILPLCTI